jgi:hypothetical protein
MRRTSGEAIRSRSLNFIGSNVGKFVGGVGAEVSVDTLEMETDLEVASPTSRASEPSGSVEGGLNEHRAEASCST